MDDDNIGFLELGNIEELVKIIAVAGRPLPIYKASIKREYVYFVPSALGLGATLIYIVKMKKDIKEKYVVYDSIHDRISYSSVFQTKPSLSHFPIITVKNQNILPKTV
jgi:hypothetical protein